MRRVKAAASAAAFVAVLVGVGAVTYVSARDDPAPPTTTTTSTMRPPTGAEIAEAITAALSQGLDVPLEPTEATCVAGGLITVLEPARLEEMADAGAGVEALTDEEHDALVRAVVGCVPPEKAEAMLSTKPPPPTVGGLPDEGSAG